MSSTKPEKRRQTPLNRAFALLRIPVLLVSIVSAVAGLTKADDFTLDSALGLLERLNDLLGGQ